MKKDTSVAMCLFRKSRRVARSSQREGGHLGRPLGFLPKEGIQHRRLRSGSRSDNGEGVFPSAPPLYRNSGEVGALVSFRWWTLKEALLLGGDSVERFFAHVRKQMSRK